MPITIEPKPYALRSVTSNFGAVASVCAAYMRAPLRRMPCLLRRAARQHARVVGQEHQRQVERVGDGDEVRGLVGAVGVDRAGHRQRLVRDHRDRDVRRAGTARRSSADRSRAAPRSASRRRRRRRSPCACRRRADRCAARCRAARARGAVAVSPSPSMRAGTTTPTTGSSAGRCARGRARAASSSATLWISPLASATVGSAEVLLGDRLARATRTRPAGRP